MVPEFGKNGPTVSEQPEDGKRRSPMNRKIRFGLSFLVIVAPFLLDGLLYYNVHTAVNPGGEIRGQIDLP
ncbi:MAG TPA: hypothetical protein DD658_05295 [Deltaproteobacteria bacterium]|nr:hypothetical protein [Deltaproteobacteria bacterium]